MEARARGDQAFSTSILYFLTPRVIQWLYPMSEVFEGIEQIQVVSPRMSLIE